MKKKYWKKYILEFLSVFIAVISAFMLNSWNENRGSAASEEKILREIKNGIELDLSDFNGNVRGHKFSLNSIQKIRSLINNKEVFQDSIPYAYNYLFNGYVPIINLSGYQSLKANGLKIIKDDTLRLEIITLYDYYYNIIEKIYNDDELRAFHNYYKPINNILHPYMSFNKNGNLVNIIIPPKKLPESQRKEMLSYLWRIEDNRKFKIGRYKLVISKMEMLKKNIENKLNN